MTMQYPDWPEYPLSAFDDDADEEMRRAADPDPDRHTPAKFWRKPETMEPEAEQLEGLGEVYRELQRHTINEFGGRIKWPSKPEPEAQPAKPYKMGIREKYSQDGYDPS